jgi:hypothetical protein
MKKSVRFFLILPFFIFCFQNKTIAQCWNNGDFTTHWMLGWHNSPGSTTLTDNFTKVYGGSSLFIGGSLGTNGSYFLSFTDAAAVINYLPSVGAAGPLTGNLENPINTASGSFGGDVLSLQLDVDFSDANVLSGNTNTKFGDLVLYGFTSTSYTTYYTDLTTLNGLTVRQYLTIVNALLGGGSSGGFSGINIVDLDPVTQDLSGAFEGGTPSTFAQQHLKKGWKNGDVVTYTQSEWGNDSSDSTAAKLLESNIKTVYASTFGELIVGGGFKMTFGSATAVEVYLPQSGALGALDANLSDPGNSSSGEFGGDVVTLMLNVDFADAGYINGSAGAKLGDLVIYNSGISALDGITVRQFLSVLNTLLGGGTSSYGTISDLEPIALQISLAFINGTPSAWAQLHLKRGWQNGDLTTYGQSPWGVPATGVGSILQTNYSTLYASTFGIAEIGIPGSSGFSMQFDVASAVFDYLPSIGTAAALTADLFDPLTSNSGQFGGDVLGLKLNIDFSDAGLLPNNSGLKFGDLTICGLTNNTDLNGKTVRQFLDIVNTALGGGTTTDPISDLDALAIDLNNSFSAGSVSQWTQLYLVNGSCDCGNTVTNHCPTASAINVSTTVGSAVKFLLQGSDADNNTLTYSISQNPLHGTAVIAGSDSVIYTPTAAYHGTDQLKYTVSDGSCSAEATVNITVIVCPGGQGYWKNNKAGWPVTTLMLGTISYTQLQLMKILNTAVGTGNNADASLILADQLIAAKLSVANGSPAVQHVTDSIAAADALIGGNLIPMKVKPNTALGKKMISLATFFANYNNGVFTQGCSAPANITGEQLIADNELIAGNEIAQIPGGFVLEQNHPNPFHGSTIISYGLPANGNSTYHVSLKIYDITGREIKTLVTDEEKAGWKTINFNAGNLAAGVYMYRFSVNQFSEMKKMIIVK